MLKTSSKYVTKKLWSWWCDGCGIFTPSAPVLRNYSQRQCAKVFKFCLDFVALYLYEVMRLVKVILEPSNFSIYNDLTLLNKLCTTKDTVCTYIHIARVRHFWFQTQGKPNWWNLINHTATNFYPYQIKIFATLDTLNRNKKKI